MRRCGWSDPRGTGWRGGWASQERLRRRRQAGRRWPMDKLGKSGVNDSAFTDPGKPSFGKDAGGKATASLGVDDHGGGSHAGGHGLAHFGENLAHDSATDFLTEGLWGEVQGQGWQWGSAVGGLASGFTSGVVEHLGGSAGGRLRNATGGGLGSFPSVPENRETPPSTALAARRSSERPRPCRPGRAVSSSSRSFSTPQSLT